MTKRLYYTDPIKVLYMMKEFGVKITCEEGYLFSEMDVYEQLVDEECTDKYCVSKESEGIFDLRIGDIIKNECYDAGVLHHIGAYQVSEIGDVGKIYTKNFNVSRQWIGNTRVGYETIMRDNKQFFMPEVDNE